LVSKQVKRTQKHFVWRRPVLAQLGVVTAFKILLV
ncbi:nitrite/Sulfite reductase ferredoxin-like half domain protein, partial [Vibrio parahaemolyticus V-223/04]